MTIKQLLGVSRANFLSLTVVCVAIGAGLAWFHTGLLQPSMTALILWMAVSAHISVNAFNEWFDFRSGLDALTQRTAFSGGSGTLINAPGLAWTTLALAIAMLAVVVGIGIWLCLQFSWKLLWLGVPGVVIIVAYTEYLNRSPLLCLLAPGMGFGYCMTLGTAWVLGAGLSVATLTAATLICLLTCNLLLLNQFPDVEADRHVGRRHFPIVLGRSRSACLYLSLLAASVLMLILASITGALPAQCLLALIPALLLGPGLLRGLLHNAEQAHKLGPQLLANVLLCHLMPLLLLAGLIWAGPELA